MKTETLQASVVDWAAVTNGTYEMPIELVRSSPDNARKTFDPVKLQALAAQIAAEGQMTPALVHPFATGDGALFQLFAGERRLRALKLNGATTISVKVSSLASLAEAHRKGLIENFAREDVNPIERGAGFHREMEMGGYATVPEMAAALGMSGEYRQIVDQMSLSKLVPDVSEALLNGEITQSHAVLIARETPENQIKCLTACFEKEVVTIGLFPETSARLISEKALRGWIMQHLREPAKDESDAVKVAEKRVEAEKRSDGERALEREGARLAGDDEQPHAETQRSAEIAKNGEERKEEIKQVAPIKITQTEAPAVNEIKMEPTISAFDKDAMQRMCLYVFDNFEAERHEGESRGDMVIRLLTELMERRKQSTFAQVFPDAVGKKKKAKKLTAKVIDAMICTAAKYVVDDMKIDETEIVSMRETGMTDESIQNLLDAFYSIGDPIENRHVADFALTFDNMGMTLREVENGQLIAVLENMLYVEAIRDALQVPQEIIHAATEAQKKKAKKASKSKAK